METVLITIVVGLITFFFGYFIKDARKKTELEKGIEFVGKNVDQMLSTERDGIITEVNHSKDIANLQEDVKYLKKELSRINDNQVGKLKDVENLKEMFQNFMKFQEEEIRDVRITLTKATEAIIELKVTMRIVNETLHQLSKK